MPEVLCSCPGCDGGGRKNAPAHSSACTSLASCHTRPYCKRCHWKYLCVCCNTRVVPGDGRSPVCEQCEKKRCQCPGCDNCRAHDFCRSKSAHSSNPKSWCRTCSKTWRCTVCKCAVTKCSQVPVSKTCETCEDEVIENGRCPKSMHAF